MSEFRMVECDVCNKQECASKAGKWYSIRTYHMPSDLNVPIICSKECLVRLVSEKRYLFGEAL
jgi:hypothetical protein